MKKIIFIITICILTLSCHQEIENVTKVTGLVTEKAMVVSAGIEASTIGTCLLYTSPSPRDRTRSRMPSSA